MQPYVYILPNGESTSVSDLKSRAEALYPQLFSDEGHFLLVFCDDGRGGYNCGYTVGSQAKTVMDDEAVSILADYLDRYYNDSSVSEEESFRSRSAARRRSGSGRRMRRCGARRSRASVQTRRLNAQKNTKIQTHIHNKTERDEEK